MSPCQTPSADGATMLIFWQNCFLSCCFQAAVFKPLMFIISSLPALDGLIESSQQRKNKKLKIIYMLYGLCYKDRTFRYTLYYNSLCVPCVLYCRYHLARGVHPVSSALPQPGSSSDLRLRSSSLHHVQR